MKYTLAFILSFIGSTIIAQIVYDQNIESRIDSLFAEYENEPGGALGIYANERILYQKGFGFSNLEDKVKITPQTVFEIAASGMNITATAILLLEEEGKLSLDDPIQDYLTEFPNYKEGKVSIRHCLHHSSGLRDYLELIKISGRNQHITFDNKSALELLKNQSELTIIPGSDYRYSHSNYLVLALIVERITGDSMAKYTEQNIFIPLEMNNTFYYQDFEKVINNRALLYAKEDDEYKLKQNYRFTACGDGRIYSTIEDMMKWSRNFTNSRIGKGKDFMEKLYIRGTLNNGDTMSYARGLEHGEYRGHRLIAHNGWWGGATGMFVIFPSDGLFVMGLGNNKSNGIIGKTYHAARMVLNIDEKPVAKKSENPVNILNETEIKYNTKDLKSICGNYFSYEIGYSRKIYTSENKLYLHDGEHEDALLEAIGENKYKKVGLNSNVTFSFGFEEDKKIMYLQHGERPPMILYKFEPANYNREQLLSFTGDYYSTELGQAYKLKEEDGFLQVWTNEKEIFKFKPLMDMVFNSPHDGYLQFEKNSNGNIYKFTINDYSLGKMGFMKK